MRPQVFDRSAIAVAHVRVDDGSYCRIIHAPILIPDGADTKTPAPPGLWISLPPARLGDPGAGKGDAFLADHAVLVANQQTIAVTCLSAKTACRHARLGLGAIAFAAHVVSLVLGFGLATQCH
jgi:hypothetical protein